MKKKDLIIVLLYPIMASLLSFLIHANFFVSTILFMGIPSIYLSIRNPRYIKKVGLFALVFGPSMTMIVDMIMETTGGWFVTHSIFGQFRLFNLVTIDILIWGLLFAYFIGMYYETFLDDHCTPRLYHPNMKYLLIAILISIGIFAFVLIVDKSLFFVNYYYIKFGLIALLLPVVIVLLKFPKLYAKFFKAGAYFFFVTLIYEFTALSLNQWTFPNENQFIGFVDIVGIRFPFEEFFFWIMLGAMAMLSYYEFFDDDKK